MRHRIDPNDLEFLEKRYGKIEEWVPGSIDTNTGKINPHVTTAILGDGKLASVFHVKPVYYETMTGDWRPLSEVTIHHGNHSIILNEDWWKIHPRYINWLDKRCRLIGGELLIQSFIKSHPSPYVGISRMLHESLIPLHIGLTTTTFYPDPNVETTTVDGYVARDGVIESWATCHDNATGTGASDSAVSSNMCYVTDGFPTDNKWCYRGVFLFDTSVIGDTDVIDSGTFSVYVTSIYDESLGDASKEYITMCSANPASNTALATSDYDYNDFGTTHLSNDVSTFTNTAYNAYIDWTLNTDGKSAISKTGVTKLAMRQGYDITNTEPIATAGYPNNGINGGKWADETGTSTDPKLVVTYSAGSTTYYQQNSVASVNFIKNYKVAAY